MKTLRQLHLYLGCIFAPVLIFFAVTGAWQLFSLHRGNKDGSYVVPRSVAVLSEVHMSQHLPGTSSKAAAPLRYFILAAAGGLVFSTTLGIIMAFRFTCSKLSVTLCLLGGVVLPLAILLTWR